MELLDFQFFIILGVLAMLTANGVLAITILSANSKIKTLEEQVNDLVQNTQNKEFSVSVLISRVETFSKELRSRLQLLEENTINSNSIINHLHGDLQETINVVREQEDTIDMLRQEIFALEGELEAHKLENKTMTWDFPIATSEDIANMNLSELAGTIHIFEDEDEQFSKSPEEEKSKRSRNKSSSKRSSSEPTGRAKKRPSKL